MVLGVRPLEVRERTLGLGVTGLVRNVGWATGPARARDYDGLLYRASWHAGPPQELAGVNGAT